MKLGQLAQNLLGAFVPYFGWLNQYLDDLIAALVLTRVEHALFAETELLAGLRARPHRQQSPAVDRGHFNLRAQTGLGDGHGNFDFNIVSVAMEERMLLHPRGDIEIAGRRALGAGVAFARNSQPRSILRAGRDVDSHSLRARDTSIAVTGRARVLQLSFAAAARAGEVEFHGARHLRNRSGAAALRAGDGTAGRSACPVARRADFVAG